MTNLEWLWEHDRDKLVKLITGECDMCDICSYEPVFPDCGGDCERNVREWLLADHVDDENCRQDAEQPKREESPDCESDSREKPWHERIDDYLATFDDSREKLEAEVRKWCGMYPYQVDMVWVWLNRQAAITESNCRIEYEDMRDYLQGLAADLEDGNAALEKELKLTQGNLKATLNNWEQARGKMRGREEELAERKRRLDERDQKTVEEVRGDRADYWKSRAEKAEAEREEWRAKCGRMADLAGGMLQVAP